MRGRMLAGNGVAWMPSTAVGIAGVGLVAPLGVPRGVAWIPSTAVGIAVLVATTPRTGVFGELTDPGGDW